MPTNQSSADLPKEPNGGNSPGSMHSTHAESPTTPSNAFGIDTAKLLSGNFVAVLAATLCLPIISRIYSPEDIGLYALFASYLMVVQSVCSLRYDLALLLPDSDHDAATLYQTSALIAGFIALLVGGVLAVAPPMHATFSEQGNPAWLCAAFALSAASFGLFQISTQWATRQNSFAVIAKGTGFEAVGTALGQISLGLGGFISAASLIVGNLAAKTATNFYLLRHVRRTWPKNHRWNGPKAWALIKTYRKFPLINTWSTLLNSASANMAVIMIGSLHSAAAAGFYAIGFRLLNLPFSLVGRSVSRVFVQRAARLRRSPELPVLTAQVLECLVVFCSMPLFLLAIFGDDWFAWFLGSEWRISGLYAQLLCVWMFGWFVSSPLTCLFSVTERQGLGMAVNTLICLSRLLPLCLIPLTGSVAWAIFAYALGGTCVYLFVLTVVSRLASMPPLSWARIVIAHWARLSPAIAIAFAINIASPPPLISLAASLILIGATFLWNRRLFNFD